MIAAMHQDGRAWASSAHIDPRATRISPQMLGMIGSSNKGYAYKASNGDVNYRAQVPGYGKLSAKVAGRAACGERVGARRQT